MWQWGGPGRFLQHLCLRCWAGKGVSVPALPPFSECSGAQEALAVSSHFIIAFPGQMGPSLAFSGGDCKVEVASPGAAAVLWYAGETGSCQGGSQGKGPAPPHPCPPASAAPSKLLLKASGSWHLLLLLLLTFLGWRYDPEPLQQMPSPGMQLHARGSVTSSSCCEPDPSWRKGSSALEVLQVV